MLATATQPATTARIKASGRTPFTIELSKQCLGVSLPQRQEPGLVYTSITAPAAVASGVTETVTS